MISKKRTKIICTIGPASNKPAKLRQMIKAGMNVARLNLSHATHADHKKLMRNVRSAARELKKPIPIIGDLQGPKIRVGDLPDKGSKLVKGQTVEVPVTYPDLYKDVKKGDRILLDDGLLEGRCVSGKKGFLKFEVKIGGPLTSHKGMNFPDTTLSVSAITEKDKRDAVFAVQQKCEWVALSFVTDPKDIRHLRRILSKAAEKDQPLPKIIAKIEKHEAIRRFDEILKEADAIMVARGDLGIETAAEQVPLVQKEIISKCRAAAKPVIVATQMLDSMIHNPRPTRAEVSDIANAVIDHADAVMLSGETATGKYPLEAVSTMAKIAEETEASHFDDVSLKEGMALAAMVSDSVGGAAALMAETMHAKVILVGTMSGQTAQMVSRFRPELPIVVAAPTDFVRRQINLSWAVYPIVVSGAKKRSDLVKRSITKLRQAKVVKSRDKIITVTSPPSSEPANLVEVVEV